MSYTNQKLLTFFLCIPFFLNAQKEFGTKMKERIQRGDSLNSIQKYPNALYEYEIGLEGYKELGAWGAAVQALNKISDVNFKMGFYDKAFEASKKALRLIRENSIKVPEEELKTLQIIAEYYENIAIDYDTALELYTETLKLNTRLYGENSDESANSFNAIGIIYAKKSNYEKALENFDKVMTIREKLFGQFAREMGPIYNNLGLLNNIIGDYESAIAYLQKAIQVYLKNNQENSENIMDSYLNLGIIYQNLSDYDSAEELFHKSLNVKSPNSKNELLDYATIYENLATLNIKKGRLKTAMDYSEKSIGIYDSVVGANHPRSMRTLRNIGEIYFKMGDLKNAILYGEKAFELSSKALGVNHMRTGSLLDDLAAYYSDSGATEKALQNRLKALDIYKSVYGMNHPVISWTYKNLALDNEKLGNDSLALDYLKKAHALNEKVFPVQHPQLSSSLTDLGAYYTRQNNTLAANHHLMQALDILSERDSLSEGYQVGDEFTNQTTSLSIFGNLAKNGEVIFTNSGKDSDLNQVMRYYDQADSISNKIRKYYNQHGDKIHFSKNIKEIYANAINVGISNRTTRPDLLRSSFHYAEKSKFNILNELLNLGSNFSGLPADISEKERQLKSKRAFYHSKLATLQGEDEKKLQGLYKNELITINGKLDSLFDVIELNYPDYFDLRYDTTIYSVNQIQNFLDAKTALIEYVQWKENIYAFVLTATHFEAFTMSAPNLANTIAEFNNAIVQRNRKIFKSKGSDLYKLLVAPFENLISEKELIIVPDNILWNVNFELLLTDSLPSNNPKEYPYMLKKHAIGYANSANLLFKTQSTAVNTKNECLAFSYSDSLLADTKNGKNDVVHLQTLRNSEVDLPGTREEIVSISEILKGSYFYGSSANESSFKKHAKDYSILHLALHGQVDNENPENSKLYFTNAKDSVNDNLLYSHELFALELPAELAVLSACETGIGKIVSGEGIMSLGSAFQYAGTKSLVLSKWEVSDATTPILMKNFYHNLKKGMTKSKALQQAKLTFLNTSSGNRSQPYYWASFFVLGDNTPIQFEDENTWHYYLLGAILVLLAFFFFRKFKP